MTPDAAEAYLSAEVGSDPVATRQMFCALLVVLRDQQKLIDALARRVNDLENAEVEA